MVDRERACEVTDYCEYVIAPEATFIDKLFCDCESAVGTSAGAARRCIGCNTSQVSSITSDKGKSGFGFGDGRTDLLHRSFV